MPYKEGRHPMFPHTEEDRDNIRKELGLKESTIQDDIDALIQWFEKQPHLVAAGLPNRMFLERMLINAKGSRERTKRRLDNFYKYRSLAHELVQNRCEYLDRTGDIWRFYRQAAMPKLLDLRRLSVLQFTDMDPNNYDSDVLLKNAILLGDIRLRYDYMLGDIWVLDLQNTGIGHLLRTNPVIFSKASRIFLDGVGIRLHAVHILGAPSYAQQLVMFFKQFAKPKILERIIFHKCLEDLYEHVPREYLPKDYGGEQPSMEYFKEIYLNVVKNEETRRLLEEASTQVSEECLRPGNTIDPDCLNGSFKKLDLD